MLKTVQITSDSALDEQLRRLYTTAFPVEEQIPYDDLPYLMDALSIDYTAYYEGETLVGLTMVLSLAKYNWWWYFAVCEPLRGKGYGQQILKAILEKYRTNCPLILDIESPFQADAPNPAQRQRRYDFYLRNGLRDTETSRTYNGITYRILSSSDEPFTQQDYSDIIASLHSVWENMPKREIRDKR